MKFFGIFSKIREEIEKFLPMTFGNLLMFFIILYFIFLVGRMTWNNYQSNKSIDQEAQKVADLEKELTYMKYQIAYFKTDSFKEKEAREKLGYKAPGEKVLVLPLDTLAENSPDVSESGDVKVKIPNQNLWWSYFFK
jgi:cell division protein FtsB